ncbi:MAG: hypothetical protein ACE5FQ_14715 [Thiogranum sp.]
MAINTNPVPRPARRSLNERFLGLFTEVRVGESTVTSPPVGDE